MLNSALAHIKVISFDLDDTLWSGTEVLIHAEKTMASWMNTHTPQIFQQLTNDQLRQRKINFIKNNTHLRYQVSQARALFLADLFAEFDYPNAKELAAQCFDVFYAARQKVTLFDDVLEVLTELNKHFKLIAITNGNANISAVGLDDHFDFCLNAEDFDLPKPHSEIFKVALSQAGVSSEQCLHVGDHPVHDMQGAKEVGMLTCWLEDGRHPWQLPFKADICITHIRDLLPLFNLLKAR
jgi:HAD superfamily hydrolase (TIGR01549 family)